MREGLKVCNRYVSLFHLLTVEDLWLWCVVVVCCLVGGFLFVVGFWFVFLVRARDLLVLTAVG